MPKSKVNRWIYWIPRILGILFLLFLAMFSLDIFEGNYGFWGTILGLFIHNIPTLVLLAFLIVSWKYELVGAIGFIFAGLLYTILILSNIIRTGFEWYYLAWIVQIAGIVFLIGILFFVGWKQKNKKIKKKNRF